MLFYVISVCKIDITKLKRPNTMMRNCCVIYRTFKLHAVMFWMHLTIYLQTIYPFWGMYSVAWTFQNLMFHFASLSGFPFLLPGRCCVSHLRAYLDFWRMLWITLRNDDIDQIAFGADSWSLEFRNYRLLNWLERCVLVMSGNLSLGMGHLGLAVVFPSEDRQAV